MASLTPVLLCGLIGCVMWTGTGHAVARSLGMGQALAVLTAPALGWGVQTPLALLLSHAVGVSPVTTGAAAVLIVAATIPAIRRTDADPGPPLRPVLWLMAAAAVAAAAPAAAVLPKQLGDGVIVASAIFDHSKIALIDQIVREGVPPANPVYGGAGAPDGVAYYYLWHFGAAQLAGLAGASGWEADAAASWFTAFSTLSLIAGLAFRLGGRWLAAVLALAVCGLGSMRPALAGLLGLTSLDGWLQPAAGFAGLLFQASWSPHHVQAAACVVVATTIVIRLARRPDTLSTLALALTATATYQSSIWIGGVLFPLSTAGVVALALWSRPPGGAVRLLLHVGAAGLVAVAMALPLLAEQHHAALARGIGSPVTVEPYGVFGPDLPTALARALDLPGYWLVLLPLEFAVVYLIGGLTLARAAAGAGRDHPGDAADRRLVRGVAVLAVSSLGVGWLLASTAGTNNDLGWRAVLPGLIVLAAAAGTGLARWIERRAWAPLMLAAAVAALTLPDGLGVAAGNIGGEPSPSAAAFARSPAMWRAVRRHAQVDQRVASNPALFADLTPWPVNLSWALLADRRSCFAGNELAVAFAPLPPERRAAIADRFNRVFAGNATPDDLRALARTHRCDVVLVTAHDGAWQRDPFAASPLFRLVETEPGEWRIYKAQPETAGE